HVVSTANQVDLSQRVEDRPGRFVELDGAPDLERAMQRLLRPGEIPDAHTDLSQRGERHRQPVPRSVILMKSDASLGERQRLSVTVWTHHPFGWVAADRGEYVVGRAETGEPLGLP